MIDEQKQLQMLAELEQVKNGFLQATRLLYGQNCTPGTIDLFLMNEILRIETATIKLKELLGYKTDNDTNSVVI